MVSKVTWSPRALADLRSIAEYISASSPMVAERFCLALIDHAETCGSFPRKGRVVPELKKVNVRELIFPPYRIVYEIQPERNLVEIMTIWHSARGTVDV